MLYKNIEETTQVKPFNISLKKDMNRSTVFPFVKA
jgi:hypothetical protein